MKSSTMLDDGSLAIRFAGEELVLLAERAALWPARRALMLSDVHFGKSATFRAHGIPVPEGECRTDLDRISRLVQRYDIQKLVIVGDFYHSGIPLTDSLQAMLISFRDTLGAEITLVRGNHDPLHHRLLDMQDRLAWAPFEFIHDPAHAVADQPTITGHLHPLCRIGHGRNSRLPCFLLTNTLLVLPAFGTFTSGHVMHETSNQALFPIANHKVFQLPQP